MTGNKITNFFKALGDMLTPPSTPPDDDRYPGGRYGQSDGTPWYRRQEAPRDGTLSGAQRHLPEDENYSHRYYGDRWGQSADESSERGSFDPSRRAPVYQPELDEPFKTHRFNSRAELLDRTPRVLISPEAFKRMCLYVEIGALEVGWLGTVTRTANGDFLIGTTYLLQQDVSPTETILSVDGINALAMSLCEQGEEGMKALNSLRFWGHSHVRMGTSPSGTDEQTMVRFGTEGHEWYVRGIFNKRGRAEFTIYLFEKGVRINDAPWDVFDPATGQVIPTRKRFSPAAAVTSFLDSMLGIPAAGTPAAESQSTGSAPSPTAQPAPAKPAEASSTPAAADASASGNANSTTGDAAKTGDTASEPAKPAPPPPPKLELPEELVPSPELRAEVEAEFKAKVKERVFRFWSIFGKDKPADGAAQPGEPSNVGQSIDPGKPVGDITSGASPTDPAPRVKPLSLKERILNRRNKSAPPADSGKDKDNK